MQQTILPFKIEKDEKAQITAHAGLGLFAEMYEAVGIEKVISEHLPKPGSHNGIAANSYVKAIIMMFLGGGKYIEDIRQIKEDRALRSITGLGEIPTSDAIGEWLKRASEKKEAGLKEANKKVAIKVLRSYKQIDVTLDIDAFEIEANKEEAKRCYTGNKGYMPMAGFVPELDICVGSELREGNNPPAARNLEVIKEYAELIETSGKRVKDVRIDSAGYQAGIINYCDTTKKKYTITARQDKSLAESVQQIKEWRKLLDEDGNPTGREVGECLHCMQKTWNAFRLVVQRWTPKEQLELEIGKQKTRSQTANEDHHYHVIATNYKAEEKIAEEVIAWHQQRSNSENYNKEVKGGYNLEYMPTGKFKANAVWFQLGILAYNLGIAVKRLALPKSWEKKTIRTIRWQLINIAGKVVKHAGKVILKLCSIGQDIYEIYQKARTKCWQQREAS